MSKVETRSTLIFHRKKWGEKNFFSRISLVYTSFQGQKKVIFSFWRCFDLVWTLFFLPGNPSGGEHARRVTFVLGCVVVLALVGNLWILLAVKQATSECLPCPETPASTVRLAEKVLKKKFFLVFFLFFLFLPKKV